MSRKKPREVRDARRAAAFERGWRDSLKAYWAPSSQPPLDRYDYARGWHACGDYRWADPSNRGVAPDVNYRPPQPHPGGPDE